MVLDGKQQDHQVRAVVVELVDLVVDQHIINQLAIEQLVIV